MILSSADVLRILGGNQIIRLSAKVEIVEGKPALSGREGLFIYIKRYPELGEFEATFTLWIESDGSEPDDIVIAELRKLLPKVEVKPGLMTEVKTTEFRSESTLEAPQATPAPKVDMSALESRFEALAEDIQDQMLLVHSGRNGQDGKDGRDGVDGQDGRDLVATEVELEDLANVEEGIAKSKGQVLTWDGSRWTNLHIPQVLSAGGAGGESTGGGTPPIGSTIQWRYRSLPVSEEPLAGNFHSNNVSGELATILRVNNVNQDNTDVELLVRAILTGGTNRLYLYHDEDPSQAQLYRIDSHSETSTGFEIHVTHLATAGPEPDFIQPKTYNFLFLPPSVADLEVGALYQLLGVSPGSTDLGSFPGSIIPDGSDVKDALAAIENHIETVPGGIPEAPLDGNFYVRQNGAWINLRAAMDSVINAVLDGGDVETGISVGFGRVLNAGNVESGGVAGDGAVWNGGIAT